MAYTDPTAVISDVAEALADRGVIARGESMAGGVPSADVAWAVFLCSGDAMKLRAAIYEVNEAGPGTPAFWELNVTFESARRPMEFSSLDGGTVDDAVAQIAAACGALDSETK